VLLVGLLAKAVSAHLVPIAP